MVGSVATMRVSSVMVGAVFGERDVEVDADEDALVGQIDVADGELGHDARTFLKDSGLVDCSGSVTKGLENRDWCRRLR